MKYKSTFYFSALFIGMSVALGESAMPHTEESSLRDAVEFTPRDGLPNVFRKLDAGEPIVIAYFGGSITSQNGWRPLSLNWFKDQYPGVAIDGINAAIGGTGSNLGVFRIDKDVLAAEPDLIFVEFAVNDSGADPRQIRRSMEGIVRKVWKADAETDICFVYTIKAEDTGRLVGGKMKRSASVMETVADHYGIPSVHLGYHVAMMEKAGKLVMKTDAPMLQVAGDKLNEAAEFATDEQGRIIFSKDGVHPYPETGHVLYAEALIRSLKQINNKMARWVHELGEPLDAANLQFARQIPISEGFLSGPYRNLTEAKEPLAQKFVAYVETLYVLEPGARLDFKFKGTTVAIYDLLGPHGGTVEVHLDGKRWKRKRMDAYCTWSRLAQFGIGDDLEDTVHEVSVRVLDETFDKAAVLHEHQREDVKKFPEKYTDYNWHVGSIFIVGDLVD